MKKEIKKIVKKQKPFLSAQDKKEIEKFLKKAEVNGNMIFAMYSKGMDNTAHIISFKNASLYGLIELIGLMYNESGLPQPTKDDFAK